MSLSEIVFLFLQPSNTLLALLLLGAVVAAFRVRLGAAMMTSAALLIAFFGLLPVGAVLLSFLEDQYAFEGIVEPPDGIIILGGYLNTRTSLHHNQIQLSDNAERITAGAALARRFPDAKVIVTDGPSEPGMKSGAELAKVMLVDFGVPVERIVREEWAASTWDNARYSYDMVQPKPGERYVLVTSAFHMPRSMATFAAAGWTGLVPWPVDYSAGRPVWQEYPGSVAQGLRMLDWAAREYLATIYYRVTGRWADPGPATAASLMGPRAVLAATGAPRCVMANAPDEASRSAAARTAGIMARQSASSAARCRATSDGQMDFGARAMVRSRMADSIVSAAGGSFTTDPVAWRAG